MRMPELSEPEPVDEMPKLVRRIFFVAAIASVGLALLAAHMVRPGLDELLRDRHDGVLGALAETLFQIEKLCGLKPAHGFAGERDKALIYMAGIPIALCGLVAAIQGLSGLPKKASRLFGVTGIALNLFVLLGAGIPALIDYLHRT